MRLPRMTIRRWMVAVALIALMAGGGIESEKAWRRWRICRNSVLADTYYEKMWRERLQEETVMLRDVEVYTKKELANPENSAEEKEIVSVALKEQQNKVIESEVWIEYWARAKQQSERCVRNPWIPIKRRIPPDEDGSLENRLRH